ncbi:sensor histidine kinase [Pedobacter sp.]|uniref:sensor histidine kinase n=1 Tax=Pedobacter sp. TaxID=1411316 RepID=UPI00396C92BF
MKKRNLWIITALMTVALLGVFVMQLFYIRESYSLKLQLFDQDVNQALSSVVNTIQKRNVVKHFDERDRVSQREHTSRIRSQTDSIVAFKVRFKENEAIRKYKQQQQLVDYLNFQDSAIRANYFSPTIISEETYRAFTNPNPGSNGLKYEVKDIKDVNGNLIDRRIITNIASIRRLPGINNLPDTIRYIAINPSNYLPYTVSLASKDPELIRKFKVEDAKAERKYQMELERLYADTLNIYETTSYNLVQDVAKELQNKDVPLENRVPGKDDLDTLIRKELLSRNINLPYSFWLTPSKNQDKIIYRNVINKNDELLPKNTYQKVVFGNDIAIADPGMLYLSFPSKNNLILSNMFVTLASSAGLLLILIFIFTYTIMSIVRQKKLSEMKNDFINNMTHEFKTPVATIMIASEALKDPDIIGDKNRVNRLANVIYDENVRLGNHIEQVLNAARADKKEIKFDVKPVKINELIAAVVDSMSLQLQKRNTHLTLYLDAIADELEGDELHLSNVIYNLIDNAIKYSVNEPKITIETASSFSHISIKITDEGIGMTREQTKRIFDQFYRVPTGNLHNVKGFGLGLNYVQDIITQMHGKIKVNSEKDKGTTFEIILPI